ncbi:MAG TPA: nucleoside hydrolase [Reyranellaceae bacterium]|nr:nucleoside hydrolase [Reyranellaceae bacterium]
MTNRLILDTDGGVDDAQALLLLIANGRAPFAVTTVFGNVDLETATRNVLAILKIAGAEAEVHHGAEEPMAQAVIDAKHVHGDDGLGGAPRPEETPPPTSDDAVGFLVSAFNEAAARNERIDFLMIGPLTNLALALKRDPGIVQGIGQLTIMGGTIYGRGNVTPAAEFNIYADPEAAGIVFATEIDTVMVPWEACVAHAMEGADVDRLYARVEASQYKVFNEVLAQHGRKNFGIREKGDALRFVDPLAAAVVVDPSIVTKSIRASVDVSLAPGVTRGMTVVDPSGRLGTPPVTLVEEVRLDRLIALYEQSVLRKPA